MSRLDSRAMFTSNSDEWTTPNSLFEKLDAEFNFNLDPCATEENSKCYLYYTKEQDGLSKDWGVAILEPIKDQYLFQPITFEPGIAAREGGHIYEGVSGTLRSNAGDNQMNVAYCVENHPADSRVRIKDDGIVQTLDARMGMGGGNVPLVMFSKVRRAQSKDDYETWKQSEVTNTLNTFDNGDVRATDIVCCDPVINVEMEVAVRKHEVNQKELVNLLRRHKGKMTNSDIASALDVPETMVAHWFRTDKYAAIPDAELWMPLKSLLGITTDEFDKQIMEYEFKGSEFDMRNRIYAGDVTPTLTTECKEHLHLLPVVYGISPYDSNAMKSDNPKSGIYEAKTSRTLDLNGGNPACNQGGMIVLEGNGQRPSHQGDGYLESDKMYTLNTIERHAVCYWDGGQTVGTLTANNAGGGQRMPDKNHFQCIIEQVDSRGGTAYSIGNGQLHDAMSPSKEVCKTLNCMDDPMKVLIQK